MAAPEDDSLRRALAGNLDGSLAALALAVGSVANMAQLHVFLPKAPKEVGDALEVSDVSEPKALRGSGRRAGS